MLRDRATVRVISRRSLVADNRSQRVRHDDRMGVESGSPDARLSHVIFPLEADADGWPPVGSERVWAFDLGQDRYQVNNAPWFVRDLAIDDVVIANAPGPHLNPIFERIESRSDHLTIRIICFRRGPP
jgi:hypothetical protein